MLPNLVKASIAHVMLAIINADDVIARQEIEGFVRLRKKYSISIDDIHSSSSLSFAQAVNNIYSYGSSRDDSACWFDELYNDVTAIVMQDGVCAVEEARLAYSIKSVFDGNGLALISSLNNSVCVPVANAIFVSQPDVAYPDEHLQECYYELMSCGFELLDLEVVRGQLMMLGEDNIVELISIARPEIPHTRARMICEQIRTVTLNDLLTDMFGRDYNFNSNTSCFFLNVCVSNVNGVPVHNFIRVPVVNDPCSTIRGVVRKYREVFECCHAFHPVHLSAQGTRMQYLSFSASLFGMMDKQILSEQKSLKRIVIDAVNCKIELEGILSEGVDVPYKALSLYLLIAWMSSQNLVLCRKESKLYEEHRNHEKVKEYVSIAEDSYQRIIYEKMGTVKDYSDPCSLLPQDFVRFKSRIAEAVKQEVPEDMDCVLNQCFPITRKLDLMTGYAIGYPTENIFVRTKGAKSDIKVSDLFV